MNAKLRSALALALTLLFLPAIVPTARAADSLRDRFGFSKVQFGGSLVRGEKEEDDR